MWFDKCKMSWQLYTRRLLLSGFCFTLWRLTTEPSAWGLPSEALRWTNWSQCFGRCSVKFQMRECLTGCNEKKLEIRECSATHNCTTYQIRISPEPRYAAKVHLEVSTPRGWRPFCHPTWDINFARKVCHFHGFSAAHTALEGTSPIDNDTCPAHIESNNTNCTGSDRLLQILSSCNDTKKAIAVCKVFLRLVSVSLADSHSGIIYALHDQTWRIISAEGWEMQGSHIICRDLGFKDALAPFSTNASLHPAKKPCVLQVTCSGNEFALGYCSLNILPCSNQDVQSAASVTCDPKKGDRQFRHLRIKTLGKQIFSDRCNENFRWYDVNNNLITNSTQGNISIRLVQRRLYIPYLTAGNAGVYFCQGLNDTDTYGVLVVYLQAPSAGSSQIIRQGHKNQEISCSTYGVPQPVVLPTWRKDGKKLADDKFRATGNNSLLIANVTKDDEGNYSCETLQVYENETKRSNFTFSVIVTNDPCSRNLCTNGRSCVSRGDSFNCECINGYTGSFCEKRLDPCSSNRCNHGGSCVSSGASFTCTCINGYTGSLCEELLDPCLSTRCNHGGSCVSSGASFKCTCINGFTGSICEERLDFSNNGGEDEHHSSEGSDTSIALMVSLGVISALLCLGFGIFIVFHKRQIAAQQNSGPSGNQDNLALEIMENDSDKRFMSLSSSCWEIDSKQIDLQSVLGSGSFGEVWKAVVRGLKGIPGETIVAVKMLKHNSSDTEKGSLAQEIALGKSLHGDRHPNIVNFLGCVSTSGPMMLILEYVSYGDLLGYLRKSRGMEDKYYSSPECCQQDVTSYDLLSFAQQIASGMSFLAAKNILHRDLAARNVLVGKGMICKITDFGLALIRDKYQYLYCTAMRKGRLPIKWTAPEHLFHDSQDIDVRVSEKSDVWSYGVVLYEIFTLGGVPYRGWNEWKVVYELKVNKYRMSQPEHVSDELYQIMLDCWNEDPNNRPTFDSVHEITTKFLQDEHYFDLDMSKYEPTLYTNVEDIAATSQAVSLETGNTKL